MQIILVVFVSIFIVCGECSYVPQIRNTKNQPNTFGIIYTVFGDNANFGAQVIIAIDGIDKIFHEQPILFRDKSVSITFLCSPAAFPMIKERLNLSPWVGIKIAAYNITFVLMESEDFIPEGKFWRNHALRNYHTSQYTMLLDLDSIPAKKGFLSLFKFLVDEDYDLVDSYSYPKFGQTNKPTRNYSAGFITNTSLISELEDFYERNGGTLIFNTHSQAILNLFDFQHQILLDYHLDDPRIGEQLALRIAIFTSLKIWHSPYQIKEKILSEEKVLCRNKQNSACLIIHNRISNSIGRLMIIDQQGKNYSYRMAKQSLDSKVKRLKVSL